MAIERLSFPEYLNIQAGIEVHPENITRELERIVRRFGSHTRRLDEGNYNLTPPIWTQHIYEYNLVVLGSGLGVMRMLPRHSDSHSGLLEPEGKTNFKAGGRLIRIPEDEPMAVVMGPNRLNPKICIYEVIYHTPY